MHPHTNMFLLMKGFYKALLVVMYVCYCWFKKGKIYGALFLYGCL